MEGLLRRVYCFGMERIRCFFSILLLQMLVVVSLSLGPSLSARAGGHDQSAYDSAFQLIRNRQFEQAIDAMIAFTHQYPKSGLLVDAIFWVGQVSDVLAKDSQAINTFGYIAKTFPNYRRILQVQVKLGKLLIKNGRLNEGLSVLTKVIDLAPSSVEAGLARRAIQKTGTSYSVHFLGVYKTTISQIPSPKWIGPNVTTKSYANAQADLSSLSDLELCRGIVGKIGPGGDSSVERKLREANERGLRCLAMLNEESSTVSKQSSSDFAENVLQNSIVGERGNRAKPDDSARVKELEQRLAELESKQASEQQAISQDTQSPSIRINTNSDGARGTISGTATDNTGIAEVLVDGQAVPVDSSGRFSASTFIPSGGIDIQITAYDLKGLSTTETVRLERSKRTQTISRLAAVNPLVGPKQKSSRDRAALIIGLEQYAAAPPADYASRDAQMFADYAREKLGIAPGNIKVLTDTEATRSGLLRALKVWLPQAVQPDKTDLYVFYAGHGMASDDGESAYIVPYGADTFLLEDTAISRERFYEEIGAAKPRTATFFFDNCYAGTTRSEERLLAQRPLSIKVQESPVPDNYLVFTAGESNQTAGVLDEVKHGRFSYFVFKGLEGEADANQDGKISAGELHKYVRESVGRFSAGAQTPTMLGDAGRWVLR